MCVIEDLFSVSEDQRTLFASILTVLGQGRDQDVVRLRRYAGRRKYDLEEQREQGMWPAVEKEAKVAVEEYDTMKVLERV